MTSSSQRSIPLTAITSFLAFSAAAATLVWYNRSRKKRRRILNFDSDDRHETIDYETGSNEALEKAFQQAADTVRNFDALLDDEDNLVFYGLYKQGTEGDAPTSGSFFSSENWSIRGQAKRVAWENLRGMPKQVAQAMYISATNGIGSARDEDGDELFSDDASNRSRGGNRGLLSSGFSHAVSLPGVENGENDKNLQADSQGNRLLAAASNSNESDLSSLLEEGVDVDYQDSSGQTALHLSSDKGSLPCINLLLKHGANVNLQDNDGVSALQTAVIAGCVDACRILLQNGADPDLADNDGDTAKSCAEVDGSADMKRLFGVA